MPSPGSSEPRSPGGGSGPDAGTAEPWRGARAPCVGADPGADSQDWVALWADDPPDAERAAAPHAVTPPAGRLVWAGPAGAAPRALLARVPAHRWQEHWTRISPPLMDHHVHGGDGVDLATSPAVDVRAWLLAQRTAGLGAVLGSLPALAPADLDAALARLRPLWEEGLLAGVHLEGPFLSPARAGAHSPAALCVPGSAAGHAVREILRAQPPGLVRTLTLAPELPGAAALEAELAAAGTVLCLGHTDVDAAGATAALARWADGGRAGSGGTVGSSTSIGSGGPGGPTPVVTHLFNALRPFHHRAPGPAPVLLDAARRGRLRLELIADDVHVAPELVDLLVGDPGLAPALCLVSDAVAATGAALGTEHRLGPNPVYAGVGAPRLGRAGVPAEGGSGRDVATGPAPDAERAPESAPLAGGARSLPASVGALLRRGLPVDAVLRAATHVPLQSLPGLSPDGILLWDPDGSSRVLRGGSDAGGRVGSTPA